MGEFELIRRYFSRAPRHALMGVGDDCARMLVAPGMELCVTTDMLVEGRHFLPRAEPQALGHKCLAVNLSDLAACGARARWATLALALPAADEAWLSAFSQGFYALADAHGLDLVGGDTTRGPLAITVTAFGEAPAGQALGRGGARAGDDLWVSGELGGAALALVHPELPGPARRLHQPQPRSALGERLRGLASTAIDLSDGLAGDLAHVLARSGVGATLHYDRIPKDPAFQRLGDAGLERRCVLSGGDDYELLFTAAKASRGALQALAGELGLPLTCIGAIEAEKGRLEILDEAGQPMRFGGGFDHFHAP